LLGEGRKREDDSRHGREDQHDEAPHAVIPGVVQGAFTIHRGKDPGAVLGSQRLGPFSPPKPVAF